MYLKNDLNFHQVLHFYTDDNVHIATIQPLNGQYELATFRPGALSTYEYFPSYGEALATLERITQKKPTR